jgi:molybdopterin-biosynthesis enzyme MoeA-like protein
MKNFYTVIIGSELLNGRRTDAHFKFVNDELLKRGFEQKASFVIKDQPKFIEDIFQLIKNDEDSVMFCFGGIGSTPDDYTRQCAANVFGDGKLYEHPQLKQMILDQFGQEAYPHRIRMSQLAKNASLLKNVVNNISGFSLENRFFFTPGFPQMAHPMVCEALDKFYAKNQTIYRNTMTVFCSENALINFMQKLPEDIDFSSLPRFVGEARETDISIASYDKNLSDKWFNLFIEEIENLNIEYKILGEN